MATKKAPEVPINGAQKATAGIKHPHASNAENAKKSVRSTSKSEKN